MKEIISTKAVVIDAAKPLETSNILFKYIRIVFHAEHETATVFVSSYKVINDLNQEYEFIREHSKTLTKTELDAIRASFTVSKDPNTQYTEYKKEELLKGVNTVIATEQLFGLTSNDLTIR